ncbi:MAG TPA: hypothetical protein VIT44_14630 [Cyclobacteriaceae bacterium]
MNIKSIVLFAAGLLFTSALVIAQTQTGSTPQPQGSTNYTGVNTSGMTQINTSVLPDPLRSTLQSNQQYKGWEGGQWYFNSTTNQYAVQMPGANPGLTTNPSTTVSAPTNPLGATNPTQGSSTSPANPQSLPANPATSSPASPPNPLSTTTTPATGIQSPTTQTSPTPTTPTWYRFDATGKLIPQPKDN